jgi:hypothetical protein
MKTFIAFWFLTISFFLYAQETVKITFDTGDKDINTHLYEVNEYAISNMDLFRKDLNEKFGATKEDLDRYLVKERRQPADVYYGYNLSRSTGKSLPTIMKMRSDKNGWGAIAKDLGIKPGSEQFHALKDNSLKKIDKDKMNKAKTNNSKNSKDDKSKDTQKNKNSTDDIKKSDDKTNSKNK